MQNDQDQHPDNLLDLMLEDCVDEITRQIGGSPYTRSFIFGSNKEHASIRNRLFGLSKKGRITVLNAMLRYGLNDQRRSHLCPLPHHLGSLKSIPKENLTLVKLAEIVRKEKGVSDDPHTRKKEFESITRALKKFTSRSFGDYANQQNALRVIYLLDKMMINPKYAQEGRDKRLLTFIKSSVKHSFEARDAHATPESKSNTHLLSDIKAYIGIEIANETLEQIDNFFYTLIDRLEDIRKNLDEIAYFSGNHEDTLQTYRVLRTHILSINPHLPDKSRKADRLDLDLYLHLNRFEYHHFIGARKEIIKASKPPSKINISRELVVKALNVITKRENTYPDTTMAVIDLDAIPTPLNKFSGLFLDLIQHALDFRPSNAAYKKSITLTQELIYRTVCFSAGMPLHRNDVEANFRLIVSSLLAVLQALKWRTKFRPRVFGYDGMSRSIITPLEQPMNLKGFMTQDEISEAYYQIWHHRREWVQHALEGSTDVADLKFDLRRVLSEKVSDLIALDDIDQIESSFNAFEKTLLSLKRQNLNPNG